MKEKSSSSDEESEDDRPRQPYVRPLTWYLLENDNLMLSVLKVIDSIAAIVTSIIYAQISGFELSDSLRTNMNFVEIIFAVSILTKFFTATKKFREIETIAT